METVGTRIAKARLKAGLQQKDLAKQAALPDPRTLWRIEAGKAKPNVEQLARIASVLKVTVDSLINDPASSSDSGEHVAAEPDANEPAA